MDNNGYVNVTKICNEATTKKGGKKEFRQWKLTSNAKELTDEISGVVGIPTTQLLVENLTSGENITRGTYVHPYLVPHVATWASAKFGVKVSVIVNDFFAKEMFDKHQNLIKKKDDKIDKLSKKIDSQNKKIKLLLKKNDDLMEQGNEVLGYAKDTNRKINHVVNERVPYSDKPEIEHQLIIMKNNDKDKKQYKYSALRVMNKSKSSALSRYYKSHPKGNVILTIKYTPNSMHLWNECKDDLHKKKIKLSKKSSKFNLREDYTEKQLIKDIKKIHNARLQHPN
ncbi:KilA N-terminal domain, N1R/P28 DNA binding protein [Acanthamoeba polyphaga lentillevirus]|nr:KilA N-terminal domain, N1R/P28 DNA binding protein [Acanthamoeba polyphaga lentillevirus]